MGERFWRYPVGVSLGGTPTPKILACGEGTEGWKGGVGKDPRGSEKATTL